MTTSIFSFLFDEADPATSPLLRAAAMPIPLTRIIAALADELAASEARTRRAEGLLTAHGRHCICHAARIAAEEQDDPTASMAGEAQMDCCLSIDPHGPASESDNLRRAA